MKINEIESLIKSEKYDITTTYFSGRKLPDSTRQILVDFANLDAGCENYCEFRDGEGKLYIDEAVRFIEDLQDEDQEEFVRLEKVLEILKVFESNCVDCVLL